MLHELGRGLMKPKLYICEYEYKKESFKADEKRIRDYVFDFALRDNGFEPNNVKIIKGTHGKPYVENNPFYFSISHCKGLVIAAVGESELGADCELIRPHDLRVLERVANENEKQRIMSSSDTAREFFRLWTMKEAFVKMLGIGIGYPLKTIDTSKEDIITADGEKEYSPVYFVCKDKFAVCVIEDGKKSEEYETIFLEAKLD